MERYGTDTLVAVGNFSRQVEGDEVIIGRAETGTFLALPIETISLLDDLGSGYTCGEAAARFEQKHGEPPDIADFLVALEARGFVAPLSVDGLTENASIDPIEPPARPAHFARFPQELAQFLFGAPMLTIYGMLIAASAALVIAHPAIWPGSQALVFRSHMSAIYLLLFGFTLASTFVHELAHLVAARAQGVPSRLGIGNRLWMVVAETDLTGLWSLPKAKRYLPLLAGVICDAVLSSFIVLFLFAQRAQAQPLLFQIGQGFLLVCLLRIAWQCFFFVRTDFYFVLTTLFSCKDLMRDSERYLRNLVSQLFGRHRPVDQSLIPAHEMRVIRAFSVLWVGGRLLALTVLVTVQIPALVAYLREIVIVPRRSLSSYEITDRIVFVALAVGPLVWGLLLWARSHWRTRIEVPG